MLKYLSKTWEITERITSWWWKLKYQMMKCICWKEINKRIDTLKDESNCWCIWINKSKKEVIIWKLYNDIIPLEEIENYASPISGKKRRQFSYKCNLCKNIWTILADRIWKQINCWCRMHIKHWKSFTKQYYTYSSLAQRCNNKNHKAYKNYGWRGIKCEWNNFEDFYKDMWESYKDWLQIDRIDNNWHYCKENCRWATPKQNSRNKRKTLRYNWIPVGDICEEKWLNYHIIYKRIHELWWEIDRAINTPIRNRAS